MTEHVLLETELEADLSQVCWAGLARWRRQLRAAGGRRLERARYPQDGKLWCWERWRLWPRLLQLARWVDKYELVLATTGPDQLQLVRRWPDGGQLQLRSALDGPLRQLDWPAVLAQYRH